MEQVLNAYAPTAAQAPVAERMAFLRKIYGLLSLSIIFAIGGAWMILKDEAMLQAVYNSYLLVIGLEIGLLLFISFVRPKGSLGLLSLFGFTFLTGVVAAPQIYLYGLQVAGQAALMTVGIFVGLSAYTIISKKDFSFLGGMLFVGLIGLFIGTLLNAFFFHSPAGQMMFAYFGVFLFSGFILFDTSNILRNYPTSEYISATLALYLDILNLFVLLMHILGGNRD